MQITLSVILDFTGTYAKSFGQVYISDDAFLAIAATVQNVMNGTARSQSIYYTVSINPPAFWHIFKLRSGWPDQFHILGGESWDR